MTGRLDRGRDGAGTRRTYATREPCRLHLSIGADELNVVVGAVLKLMDGAAMLVPRVDAPDDDVFELVGSDAQMQPAGRRGGVGATGAGTVAGLGLAVRSCVRRAR